MQDSINHDALEAALRRCGSSWDAAQTHGLLAGRLAVAGAESGFGWLSQVLEGTAANDALRHECESMLGQLFEATYRQLSERQSEFEPLLPQDSDSPAVRAAAIGRWCEGFLHGLVGGGHGAAVKARLADEPLADIIRDMLEITRAAVDDDSYDESVEEAYAELVEYLRVATQLVFEELGELRTVSTHADPVNGDPEVLH